MFKRIVVVVFLMVLVALPRFASGFFSEKRAQEAINIGDFVIASQEFELAANRLFWRDNLWNEVGKAKLIIGQKTEAIIAYENAKSGNALSAFGWDILGRNEWEDGNKKEALALWEEGLALHPAYYEFYSHFVMVYREDGNQDAEKKALEDWLGFERETEKAAPFHYRLGLLLILDDPEKALDELTLAARLDEKFAPVVETLSASLHLTLLENDPAESTILLGRGLALAEEWELAENVFYTATQAHPENASAWAWLGEAKQHLGVYALPDLDTALNLQRGSTLVRSLRGLYWQRQGDFSEALIEFQAVAALEPENPNWQAALGEVYANAGDLPPALAAYSNAVELSPDDPHYRHQLALFSVQYGVDVENIGLPAAEKIVSLYPDNANYANTLGWIYFSLDQVEDAENELLRALELEPDLGAAHLHLGVLYLKYNHLDLAHESLLQAIEHSSGTSIEEQAKNLLAQYFKE